MALVVSNAKARPSCPVLARVIFSINFNQVERALLSRVQGCTIISMSVTGPTMASVNPIKQTVAK